MMADDPRDASDISDKAEISTAKEDAETTAARRELKQTSISDKGESIRTGSEDGKSNSDEEAVADKTADREVTPGADLADLRQDDLKEQVSSPKKKRAHDELDEPKDELEGLDDKEHTDDIANGSAGVSRTDRSEPEKKRARDQQGDSPAKTLGLKDKEETKPATATTDKGPDSASAAPNTKQAQEQKPQTSTAAFAKSPFAKLAASSESPFGALATSGKPKVFGSGTIGSQSPFAALGAAAASKPVLQEPPKLSFGSSASSAPSPFQAAGLNGQKSAFASPFASTGFSGPRLSSFANSQPLSIAKNDKPARPFGAPESDVESGSEDSNDAGEDGDKSDKDEDKKDGEKDDAKATADDKKKLKLQKIVVDDGEGDEVTLLAVRARMYQMEKGDGWKERGAGMLKVNVPKASIELDEDGTPDIGSFDASVLDGDEGKGRPSVRLVMRQDHTLRVILNTAIVPAMDFKVNQKLKASYVLFTSFDGAEVNQVQMKMSEASSTLFVQLTGMIQKQLSDV